MFVIGNILLGTAKVLDIILSLYFWIVIIAVLLTWVRPDPYNNIVRIFYSLTEPLFYRVRKFLPFTLIGGLDLSPVVILILIQLLQTIVVRSLYQYGAMLN